MKAQFVYESLNAFERGQNPYNTLKIGSGQFKLIDSTFLEDEIEEDDEGFNYFQKIHELVPENLYELTEFDFYYDDPDGGTPGVKWIMELAGRGEKTVIGTQDVYVYSTPNGGKIVELGLDPGYIWVGDIKAAFEFFEKFPEEK